MHSDIEFLTIQETKGCAYNERMVLHRQQLGAGLRQKGVPTHTTIIPTIEGLDTNNSNREGISGNLSSGKQMTAGA